MDIEDEWRQHVVDMLEIANTEQCGLWMQLKGLHQGVEAANMVCHIIRTQLKGMCNTLKYISRISYKVYIVSHVISVREAARGS